MHPKPTTSWLKLILHLFGVGTSHGQPWTHLTHHGPNSGEANTFPHIIFSAALRCTCIQMAILPGLPKWSPEIFLVWTPGTLDADNFLPQARIGTRSEANL